MAEAPRAFSSAGANTKGRSAMGRSPLGASPFGGNGRGRPSASTPTYQFAGGSRDLSAPERALISSTLWQRKRSGGHPGERAAYDEAISAFAAGGGGDAAPTFQSRSAQGAGARGAAIAARNEGRRLPNERGFFNPDSQKEGGTGTSPKNPWA